MDYTAQLIEKYLRGEISPLQFSQMKFQLEDTPSLLARAIQTINAKNLPLTCEQVWEASRNRQVLCLFMTIRDRIDSETLGMPLKSNKTFKEPDITNEAIEAKRQALLKVLEYLKEKGKEGS